MSQPTVLNQNSPTIGALAAAFWAALVGWGLDAVSFPAQVEATGGALAIGLGAWAIGRFVQKVGTDPKVR